MFELAHPGWLFLLLLVVGWGWLAWRRAQGEAPDAILNHPALPLATAVRLPAPGLRGPVVLYGLAFALLVLALAQPREVGDWVVPPAEGRDMVLLIDTSLTMSIRDFAIHDPKLGDREVERMSVLKDTLSRFIQGRAGDRFGVIVFGSEVATLTPPTFDRAHAIAQIQRIQVGMAGNDTALGDALGMALKQVRTRRLRPVIILVSDGADNNAGTLTPAEALAVAHQTGVAIHALQFGSDPYASGRSEQAGHDPQPGLADLARLTQGQYFSIQSATDATRVMHAIDKIEPTLPRSPRHRQVHEGYWAVLAFAAVALVWARWLALRHRA
ncbi:MAG: VWA domain-containing protein [Pseudomonadota bacterium]